MPVSRLTTESLAADVAAIYADVELRVLRMLAQHMAAGADSPAWAEAKLAELQVFRRRVERLAAEGRVGAVKTLARAMVTAYLRGTAAGQGDVDALGVKFTGPATHAERAVEALVRSQAAGLAQLELRVTRSATDAYRAAVVRAAAGTLTGASTRLQDAQYALDELARSGLTGFVDTAGRRWGLTTYVEMATRATTAQAAVQGHLDRLDQAGIPLVIVSDSPRECEICRPWEGKVLSRGPVAAMLPNVLTGELERVQVDGTVAEATAAGLLHPNCTHGLTGYLPGATIARQAGANPEGYAERQEQRRLERGVREWRRREAVAVTPEAQRQASAKVREWQGRVREHTAQTGLPRKYNRESLTAAR